MRLTDEHLAEMRLKNERMPIGTETVLLGHIDALQADIEQLKKQKIRLKEAYSSANMDWKVSQTENIRLREALQQYPAQTDPRPHLRQMRLLSLFLGPVLATLLIASCGGEYNIHADPVQVNVKADITFSDLMSGFKVQCRRENPSYTEDQVASCASDKLTKLFTDIDDAINH